MDFTLNKYKQLIKSFTEAGITFYTLHDYVTASQITTPCIILRHDVEARYPNALAMARIENKIGISGSYYFRLYNIAENEPVIRQIAALGHEIGYHYDDLSHCRGNVQSALRRFQKHLATLRNIAPVTTITMEGAPLSRFDNRHLWKHYNYRDFEIIAEPYFDLDFNQVFYLTDTGRRWDGWRVSVRDKVPGQTGWVQKGLVFHSTRDIIRAVQQKRLPDRVMITVHPQRWNDSRLPWLKELVMQKTKNVVKWLIVRFIDNNSSS